MKKDHIALTVPAMGEYAKTVRMTAAGLASKLGMTYDEVDDVRMAAEEAFVFACDCQDESSTITFAFALTDDSLAIEVGPLPGCDGDHQTLAASEGYAEFILKSVCDEFSIDHTAEGGVIRLVHYVAGNREGAGA